MFGSGSKLLLGVERVRGSWFPKLWFSQAARLCVVMYGALIIRIM